MKLLYAVLGLSLAAGGCSLIIGNENAGRIEKLIEVRNHMKYGIPNYYSEEELAERRKENCENIKKIQQVIERCSAQNY